MNEEAKKKILRQIPYGLYVIGVRDESSHHAFTASFFSQCSMRPPRVMMGVRHGTHSLDMIRQSRVFSVNLFSKKDQKIVERFFKAAPSDGSRFGDLGFTLKKTQTPVLDGSTAYLECEVKDIVDAGDHSVVIGEIIEAEVLREEPPLIMSDTPWHYGG